MFNQLSLFIILLAPVIAYLAGALLFSLIEGLRKDSAFAKYGNPISYRNGL